MKTMISATEARLRAIACFQIQLQVEYEQATMALVKELADAIAQGRMHLNFVVIRPDYYQETINRLVRDLTAQGYTVKYQVGNTSIGIEW